jgi:8-oxo-dGTP pyrophosphatase MutT (NUDIX family)
MYKVFINAHLIRLLPKDVIIQDEKSHLAVFDPSRSELQILVDCLFKEQNAFDVELYSDDPDDLWSTFESSFKIIEAAGGMVLNQRGEKLLIKRLGRWDLPKGKMEKGESPEDSAIREVEEECGLGSLKIVGKLEPTFHMYQLGELKILKKTHWFRIEAQGDLSVIPQIEEGISEVRWFAEKELPEARRSTYRSLEELI